MEANYDEKQSFVINVHVIEGRHYPLRNINSYVHVKIGRQQQYTTVQKFTDTPFYDQRFTFDFRGSMNDLLSTVIIFSVFKPKTCLRRRRLIGRAVTDAALIMSQPEHMIFSKWLILLLHTRSGGIVRRGFLQISMGISSKDEPAKIPETITENSNNIERNLLVPLGMEDVESTQALLIFTIYRADGIPSSKCALSNIFNSRQTNVQVNFAGNSVHTSTSKRSESPVWNEQIRILDLFPPLSQRISIELREEEMGCSKSMAQHFIDLRDISRDGEKAFLPTFGPTFIHMFSKKGEYMGRILMAIETEALKTISGSTKTIIQPVIPLNEEEFFEKFPLLVYCAIFNADCIASRFKNKQISFQIDFGSKHNNGTDSTTWSMPVRTQSHNNYLAYDNRKPAMFIQTTMPDVRRRIYNSNMLAKIAETLKQTLTEIENIFMIDKYNDILTTLFSNAVDKLEEQCLQYIDLTAMMDTKFNTKLDERRMRYCTEVIQKVANETKKIPRKKFSKHLFRKVQYSLEAIENIVEDQQESWPDIFIWLRYGSKKVGYHRIPARKICFSDIQEQTGKYCGKIYNSYFLPISTPNKFTYNTPETLVARVRLYIWLGSQEYKSNCIESLPKGHTLPTNHNLTSHLPTSLNFPSKYHYQMKAYIYQARLIPGIKNYCLLDPYVRIYFVNNSTETKVIRNTLNPTWNQTVILSHIYLYHDLESFAPQLLIEVYDLDKLKFSCNLYGRGVLNPKLKLSNGNYMNDMTPKLKWVKLKMGNEIAGEILMDAELLQLNKDEVEEGEDSVIDEIPENILPKQVGYRIEILFWGIRQIRQSLCFLKHINRPKITIKISDQQIHSSVLPNALKFLNFSEPFKYTDMEIPDEINFAPPISIELFDYRSFGRVVFLAITTLPTKEFFVPLFSKSDYENRKLRLIDPDFSTNKTLKRKSIKSKSIKKRSFIELLKEYCLKIYSSMLLCLFPKPGLPKKSKMNVKPKSDSTKKPQAIQTIICEDIQTDLNWWSKFLASTEAKSAKAYAHIRIAKIKVYNSELEKQRQFSGFTDFLKTFNLHCGKKTGDDLLDEKHAIGKFKGAIKIYRYPLPEIEDEYVTPQGFNINNFILKNQSYNEPQRILVRLYVIRGRHLRSKDIGSGSDPYIKVLLGNRLVYDGVKEYQQDVDNPIFASKIEVEAQFPEDYLLTVQVWDKDVFTMDDFIGETKIDIENRYYSKHHATCGIPYDYCESGYNTWRDTEKPSQILWDLCKKYNVDEPIYSPGKIVVGPLEFTGNFSNDTEHLAKERLSLIALHNWHKMPFVGFHLVPEHVETRFLFNESHLEQGKIQLWVDMFSITKTFIPKSIDITPHKPISYELRVIIWNTEDVLLVDRAYLTSVRMTDIYIRGWVIDRSESQSTDVHYHSLTGEVLRKKVSPFAPLKEIHVPCRLTLQVWDNDTITPDDFIGSINIELAKCQKGAKSAKTCTLGTVQGDVPVINLFKTGRTRGWWPFLNYDKKTNKLIVTGKIDMEIELLPLEEAVKKPAGLGRDKPQELPQPKRPDTSFSWLRNPLRALRFLCRIYSKNVLLYLIIMASIMFVLIAVYSLPTYTVGKLLGIYRNRK